MREQIKKQGGSNASWRACESSTQKKKQKTKKKKKKPKVRTAVGSRTEGWNNHATTKRRSLTEGNRTRRHAKTYDPPERLE